MSHWQPTVYWESCYEDQVCLNIHILKIIFKLFGAAQADLCECSQTPPRKHCEQGVFSLMCAEGEGRFHQVGRFIGGATC